MISNGGYLPEDLMLTARREEIEWVRFEGVYELLLMQECKVASKKLLNLICGGHRQVCGSDTQENSNEVVCKRIQDEKSASQLFSAMPPLEAVKVLVSIMMSVSLSNKGKTH